MGDNMKEEQKKEKFTYRGEEEKKYLEKRLHIIEGQVRGVSQMLEEDRYCGEVLVQVAAITQSLKGIANYILEKHLSTCVVREVQQNHLEIMNEVMDLIHKMDSI